jgi:nucleoside-diphosphate-sugar epimerase
MAENIIKQSGLDYLILRLTAVPYLTIRFKDLKQMFDVPLDNRVEFCHPQNVALAVNNAVTVFNSIKGKTLIISGGSSQRMLFRDMVKGILQNMNLPLPPERKFSRKPYCLDWYDTTESERLLSYQKYTFQDYLEDFRQQLERRFGAWFIPGMKHVISPVFGKIITGLL